MQNRYRLYRRNKKIFYLKDRITGKVESLKTSNRIEAQLLWVVRNQAIEQPLLCRELARVYLSGRSPESRKHTWSDVMDDYGKGGISSTRSRKDRVFKSSPFDCLRAIPVVSTDASNFFAVLNHLKAGNSTHHYLRRLHNHALYLGWLMTPVIANAAWPPIQFKQTSAITGEEHIRIVSQERNAERRLYYEMLWETGGFQSDVATMHRDRIDLGKRLMTFPHSRPTGKGGVTYLSIGPRIFTLLDQLPQNGYLFPTIRVQLAKNRASYFRKICLKCGISGKSLHSYRFAWAQRAQTADMPERDAMSHLGNQSRAVRTAYSKKTLTHVLPLEFYESQKEKNIAEVFRHHRQSGWRAKQLIRSPGTGSD